MRSFRSRPFTCFGSESTNSAYANRVLRTRLESAFGEYRSFTSLKMNGLALSMIS
jgi:hypothetical protein